MTQERPKYSQFWDVNCPYKNKDMYENKSSRPASRPAFVLQQVDRGPGQIKSVDDLLPGIQVVRRSETDSDDLIILPASVLEPPYIDDDGKWRVKLLIPIEGFKSIESYIFLTDFGVVPTKEGYYHATNWLQMVER